MDIESLLAATKDFSGIWQLIFNLFGVFIASSVVIEISPIKINPLQKIFQLISKGFKKWFQDVIDDSLDKSLSEIKEHDKKRDELFNCLTEKVDNISKRMDANEARAQANHIAAVRRSILGFADNLRAGMDASKESYDDILDQYDEYDEWIKKTKTANGRMTLSIEFIRQQYQQLFNKIEK